MKKAFRFGAIATLIAMALSSCNTEELMNLQQQIDELKSIQIASMDTQIASIKASISSLQTTDTELRGYIATLQEQQAVLAEEDRKLTQAIEAAKASLSGEITSVEAGLIAQLEAYRATVDGQIAALNTAIETLQAKDATLQQQIADLKTYSDGKNQETKEWATTTFVTLQKYNETTELIATIQGQISSINTQMEGFQTSLSDAMAQIIQLRADLQQHIAESNTALTQTAEAITAAYTAAIENAITASETSLKNWVNTQLTAYYTAAQTDAKLATLQAEQEQKLNQQKVYVETLIANLQTVLEGKINANKALIDGLQGQVNNLSGEAGVLAKAILDQADSIANNAARINENAQAIAQNSSDIAACEALIATNKTLIATNEAAIAANDTAIVALQAKAAANEQGIAGNVVNIAKNAADIAVNANLIAANATAISNNATAISDNAAAIAQLRTDLQTSIASLTEGYQSAIQTAITTLDGKLTGEIATNVTALNTRISQEVEAINTAIAALDARVTSCENEISAIQATIATILADIETLKGQVISLLARIQSVSYVPRYDDGKATMIYLAGAEPASGIAILDFKIMPSGTAAALAEVWQTALSAEATYTTTRARTVTPLPVVGVEVSGDILTVTIDGANLSPEFYAGTKKAAVALVISDGNNDRTSDYIPIVPQATLTDLTLSMQADCSVLATGTVAPELQDGPTALRFYYSPTETTAEGLVSNGESIVLPVDNTGHISATLLDLEIRNYHGVAELTIGSKKLRGTVVAFNNIPEPVDMGLSVKWATFNVGAIKPKERGKNYVWGETESNGDSFLNKYTYNSSYQSPYEETDNKTILEKCDDVAIQNLGSKWRIPRKEEWEELSNTNNCTWVWTTDNNIDGYEVTSKITGKTIFLPAAGRHNPYYDIEEKIGLEGQYWSSSLRTAYYNGLAWDFFFSSDVFTVNNDWREYGQQIRPIYGDYISVEEISLSMHSVCIDMGSETCITVTLTPSDAFEKGILWSCAPKGVVSVDYQGIITPISIGTTTITVTSADGGYTDECIVTVVEPQVPETVDMGLSVKWASWNLGASRPENNGGYYSWGEIETKDSYNAWWGNYKWCNGSENTITKYCTTSDWGTIDNKTILEKDDDAAAVNLGGSWRIPTKEEWLELINSENCTWAWATRNGMRGQLVTSKITGNSIFLPAAGGRYDLYEKTLHSVGETGFYWSSNLHPSASRSAWQVNLANFEDNLSHRYNGITIRPVCDYIDYDAISITTGEATVTGYSTATLNSQLTIPENVSVRKFVKFYYSSTETTLEALKNATHIDGTLEGESLTADLTGLSASTTYYYTVVVKVCEREFWGQVKSFTTKEHTLPGSVEDFGKGTPINGSIFNALKPN